MGQYDELADLVRKYLALTGEIALLDRSQPVWETAGMVIQSQEDFEEAESNYKAFRCAHDKYQTEANQLVAQKREVRGNIMAKLPRFGFLVVEDCGKKYSVVLHESNGMLELSINEYNP